MEEQYKKDLYERGEERFGSIGSRMYSFSRIIPTVRNFYKFVLEDLNSMEFQNILDIGCGDGHVIIELAKARSNFKGRGIDPSQQMVNVATKRSKGSGVEQRINFKIGSSREIPDKDKYNVIYTTMSFHHWKEREKSIEGIMQRLKQGGSFIVYEVTDNGSFSKRFVKSHLMDAHTFQRIAQNIGLEIDLKEKSGFIRCMFKRSI
ncbi:class I SAM-dependent methyltransferase [Oxyplasma meridianum]|uniref:Class I SAM-dependent methyltransferase n=1 Tax=Oxyplasma meridianum TaxID=3073602 RepID=A0AAX4NGN8_9ARCH